MPGSTASDKAAVAQPRVDEVASSIAAALSAVSEARQATAVSASDGPVTSVAARQKRHSVQGVSVAFGQRAAVTGVGPAAHPRHARPARTTSL